MCCSIYVQYHNGWWPLHIFEQGVTMRKRTKELTARQREVLDFIREYSRREGVVPTVREIGKRFGMSSTGSVRGHLKALMQKGHLEKVPHVHRGLRLVAERRAAMEMVPNNRKAIPLVGRVAAGSPILAEENVETEIDIDPSMFSRHDNLFALRVQGDSMIEAGIMEGDVVVVEQQKDARSGDIVVALVGEDATVKRYYPQKGKVRLQPENKRLKPIFVDERSEPFSLVGKVVGVMRTY